MIGFEHTAVRFVGDSPRTGIRPAMDGRQDGVRELLQAQTRGMALPTAALIRDTQRHPDGFPVDVVDPDRAIGGVYGPPRSLFRRPVTRFTTSRRRRGTTHARHTG